MYNLKTNIQTRFFNFVHPFYYVLRPTSNVPRNKSHVRLTTSHVLRPTSFVTRLTSFTLLITTLLFLPSSFVQAAVPHLINYQGRLTDTAGIPLNGSYAITFRIFNAETAGTMLWEETQGSVVVQKGIFSVLLGSVTNLGLAFDIPYFLEIKVGTEVMSPRQRITSAGYAIRAETATTAETADTPLVDNDVANKKYVDDNKVTDASLLTQGVLARERLPADYIASNDILYQYSSTIDTVYNTSYLKFFGYRMALTGNFRMTLNYWETGGGTGYFRIYKNGVVWSEFSTNSSTPALFSKDFTSIPGDNFEIYMYRVGGSGSDQAHFNNFAIRGTLRLIPSDQIGSKTYP